MFDFEIYLHVYQKRIKILKNSRVQINSKLKEKSRTLNSINDKLYLPGFARSRQDVFV